MSTGIEVKNYKLKALPNKPIPNAILYIKADGDSAISTYITDVNGIPYPLKDDGSITNPGVQTVFNTDGTISVIGTTDVKVSIQSDILDTINSAVQPEDLPSTKLEFNNQLADGDFLFVGDVSNYTDEQAQDAVGNTLTDTTTIDFSYNDNTPSISASVKPNSITPTELADNINLTEFVNDAGFENTPQLNTRDINNRNRANHTGVQTISTITNLQNNLDLKENKSEKNIANGYAGLGSDGKIFNNQLPALAITDTFVVSSQVSMLALIAEIGDIAVRTDLNKTFILKGSNPSLLSDWQELLSPTDSVSSVFGRTGTVVPNSGDYNTSLVPDALNKRYVTDANLVTIANQSGVNTGDETTSSIQSKRPLKTINSISLEGTGDISIANEITPDATTTVKGKLKLAGDLGGTADAPTVPNKIDGSGTVNKIPLLTGSKSIGDSIMSQGDKGIIIEGLRPSFSIGFSVSRYSEVMNRHIFEDYSLFNPLVGGSGMGIFDASTELMGTVDNAHMMAYQSRLKYTSSGDLLDSFGLTGLIVLNSHEGNGDVVVAHGVLINDVGGAGLIGTNYGIKIENISRGLTSWAIHSDGGDSQFKGDIYNLNGKGFFSFMHGDKFSTDSQYSAMVSDGKTAFYSISKGSYSPANFTFRTYDGVTLKDLVEISVTGNLGINNTSPTYRIDAIGADNNGFRFRGTSGVEAILGVSPTVVQVGSKTNHPVQIVVGENGVATFDAGGNMVITGGATWGDGVYSSGHSQIYNDASNGSTLASAIGSVNDFLLTNGSGQGVLQIPTGTQNIVLNNNLKVTGLAGTGTRMTLSQPDGTQIAGDIAPTSGTYTPTFTNIANTSSISNSGSSYTRIGNIVTVYIRISFAETAGSSAASVRVTLPVNRSSTLTNSSIGNGTVTDGGTTGNKALVVSFDTLNNSSCIISYRTTSTFGNVSASASFQYLTTE